MENNGIHFFVIDNQKKIVNYLILTRSFEKTILAHKIFIVYYF